MKLAVVLACFVVSCLADKPQPCTSPPLLTGGLMVSSQNEKISMYGKYLYDAVGQRVRLFDIGSFKNQSFTADVLLHFREAVMYEINDAKKTCKKSPLTADFQPLKIPNDAAFLSQTVVGSSSAPGQGVLVNNWIGTYKLGGYLITVTESGCFPVSSSFQTTEFGWVLTNYFNNVIGITDPDGLEPPAFCAGAVMDAEAQPRNFLSSLVIEN